VSDEGSANPALTVMALASRLADRMAFGRVSTDVAGNRLSSAQR